MLKGKTVLLGVTGSIAAYKIAYLASALNKLHAQVHVLMTENATNFINPITFESLTGNKCLVDTFDRNFQFQVEHVSLAKQADVVMIAPASANVIGKLAHGIADDMLTTTVMACKCKKYISPAMNTNMYENPVVQDNLKILEHYGFGVIDPAVGYLACGDTGAGKMPEPEVLLQYILREIAREKDLAGRKLLVTAGPTQESIDPVRYITNHSSGKMGYACLLYTSINPLDVHEKQLCQIICAYRIFLPFAGITVSSRESAQFRNGIVKIAATKVSAGVSTGIGDHEKKYRGKESQEISGDEQFEIDDSRSLDDMYQDIEEEGLQPVLNDYVYV